MQLPSDALFFILELPMQITYVIVTMIRRVLDKHCFAPEIKKKIIVRAEVYHLTKLWLGAMVLSYVKMSQCILPSLA